MEVNLIRDQEVKKDIQDKNTALRSLAIGSLNYKEVKRYLAQEAKEFRSELNQLSYHSSDVKFLTEAMKLNSDNFIVLSPTFKCWYTNLRGHEVDSSLAIVLTKEGRFKVLHFASSENDKRLDFSDNLVNDHYISDDSVLGSITVKAKWLRFMISAVQGGVDYKSVRKKIRLAKSEVMDLAKSEALISKYT